MSELVWCEKYRPQTIDGCILPEELKKNFKAIVEGGELTNLLLTGVRGTGKTTVARALCRELGYKHIFINGSESSGIDTLRTDIRDFATTGSAISKTNLKVVIIDECEYLSANTMHALRGFMEEFTKTTRFILTCNHKHRLIPEIHSRCAVIDFVIPSEERPKIAGKILKNVCNILEQEGVAYEKPVVAEMIMKFFPDMRGVINKLQNASMGGAIDSSVLKSLGDEKCQGLMESLKAKDFKKMRQWAADNAHMEMGQIFNSLFEALTKALEPSSIPAATLILADYQHKAVFVSDHEINLTACFVELAAECKFK